MKVIDYGNKALIIGAGPAGLFSVFELGLLGIDAVLIDNLNQAGGQCIELYPDKYIYDIPAIPKITGRDLTYNLLEQIKIFKPEFHFSIKVTNISQSDSSRSNTKNFFSVITDSNHEFRAKVVILAAGSGCFEPKKMPLIDANRYEGKSLFYSIKDQTIFNNKDLLIVGGGDSALDWANQLSSIANVTLMHRRDGFKAVDKTIHEFRKLTDHNKAKFVLGQIIGISGDNNSKKEVKYRHEGKEYSDKYDYILPFFGLTMKTDFLANLDLELENKRVKVNTKDFETSKKGLFAIGDINFYQGKLKLILSAFHEAALMSQKVYEYIHPGKKLRFQYSTTSSTFKKN